MGLRTRRGALADGKVTTMRCACCGTAVRMLGSNLRRLTEAGLAHYRVPGGLALDMSALPEADWAKPVDDMTIALAVVHAMSVGSP
jgi:hypothetical protein